MSALRKDLFLGIGLVLGVGLLLYLAGRQAAGAVVDVAGAVGDALSPTSSDNLIYQGTNAVGRTVTGDASFSLGGWLYDVTHSTDDLIRAMLGGALPATQVNNLSAELEAGAP